MIFLNLRRLPAVAAVFLSLASPVWGQTLAIDNDIQTHATLAGTTVTMTGRSELRITGATTPITGSVIHLNSPDAWLFFTAIRPSVVNSTYLGQIRVNGANALLNTNCRIVQHADGTVVIPHGSTFAPMQVFSGSHFTGTALSLTNFTAYNDGSLGALANKISSFKLKRGYTATIAQNASGSGVSRNYVAQDGDVEVALLPADLDDSVSFIRIFPWRWTGKKGMAGNISSGLNVRWDYNWNIDRNSSLDTEYVPIRQERWWPNLAQNWNTRGANHLLGYNEPDSTDQSNIAVGDAIWSWPDLLGTGLRVGSPAPTDGGLNWLYSFMDQADAAKLRVDFVAVHYYRSFSSASDPDGATTQFYNFLKGVYDRVQRPLWVTEWNNGANWTTGPDPTLAQNAATVAKMIEMLDNTPFVERYSLYNWVEDVRRVKWDDGSLTAAGVAYRDKVSPLSHTQVIPEVLTPASAFYRFENNTRDSGANGHAAITRGAAEFATGKTGRGLTMSGNAASGDHVLLPPRLGDSADFTFGAWVYWNGGANWQRIFDLGTGTDRYAFLSPAAGSGNVRFAIKTAGAELTLDHNAPLPVNTWTHVAVTLSGNTGKLFINGSPVDTDNAITINPIDLGTTTNYLGKSQFAADPLFAGVLDDVQFLDRALSDTAVMAMTTNVPPQFVSGTLSGGTATQGVAYNGTLSGTATDPGDTISYSKFSGPGWLTVAADGTLSGTPNFNEEGTHEFIVYATDSAGATATALLTIQLPSVNGNGTWTHNGSGDWGDTSRWSGGFPANGSGQLANFSTLNLTADATVNVDAARSIGSLQFGDTAGTQSWTMASVGGKLLTLESTSGTPSIAVNQNTATLAVSLGGTNLNKTGPGTLVLAGDNSLSGILNIDTSSTTANEGVVRLAHPNAAVSLSSIQIRNNNAGASTLELDGALGPVITSAPVTLSGRTGTVPAIRNVSGDNTLAGTLSAQSGGGEYRIESNAGQLELTGAAGIALRAETTGTRTFTLQGTGDGLVSGRVENGNATVNLAKSGTGSWELAATNPYTGTTSVSQGTLVVNGTTGTGATTVSSGATLGGRGTVRNNLTANAGAILRAGASGFPISSDVSFSLIDDFQNYPVANIGTTPNTTGNIWTGVFDGTANAKIVATDDDRSLAVNGTNAANGWRGAITNLQTGRPTDFSLPHGQTGTYFFRVRRTGTATTDVIFGLTDRPALTTATPGNDTTSPWDEYAIMLSIFGDSATSMLRAFDTGDGDVNVAPVTTVQWLNLWIVADNATKTFRIATSTGDAPGTDSGRSYDFGRRTAATVASNPLVTFGIHEARNVAAQFDDFHFASGVNLANPLDPQLLPRAETLTVENNLTLSTGATLEFDVSTGPLHDRLVVGGQLQASGTLRVTLDPATPAPVLGDSFDLFDAGTSTISFSALDLPPLASGLKWDSSAIASGMLSVVVDTASYATWAGGHAFPPGTSGPADDAESDGIANAFEWLFGTDPLAGNAAALPKATLRAVTGSEFPGADPSKRYLSISATVRKSIPGMSLIAQAAAAPDLLDAAGSSDFIISRVLQDLGDFEEREWIRTVPVEGNTTGFMRLKMIETTAP
jgi:autotransporter-associated beta strand protein